MELDFCILSRRTCRDYKNKPVSMGKIGEILEISRYAPSAGNLQNWRFIVVTDKNKREKLSDISAEQCWMADAPVHIVICNQKKEVEKEYGKKGKELYSIQNCAIVATHIILKAQDLGLATAFIGAFDDYELQKYLDIPDDITPEAIITIGYPNKIDDEQIRDPIKVLTFFEKWGKKNTKQEVWPITKQTKILNKKLNQAKNRAGLKAKGILRKIKK
jgi:nitroreductase